MQNTDFQAIFAGRAQGHEGDAHGTATQKTRIMAIIKSPLGKFKGRIGNTVFYDRNGENLVRKKPAPRPLRTEAQKRHAAEFGTIADIRGVANELIQVGFPGGGGLPKGGNGFMKANATGVATAVRKEPGKPLSRRKRATDEFACTVDYTKLRVAGGPLAVPKAKASLNAETGEVVFECEGTRLESVDCFLDDRIIGVVMVCGGYWCLWEEIGTRGGGGRLETDFQLPSPGEKVRLTCSRCRRTGARRRIRYACFRPRCGKRGNKEIFPQKGAGVWGICLIFAWEEGGGVWNERQ